MRAKDVFKVYAVEIIPPSFDHSGYEYIPTDITDGILDVSIETGLDYYEGPWQQSDTGMFTLVSRNPNLDPKTNPLISYNRILDFYDIREGYTVENEYPFFRGWITDIDVEYIPNDNPIITITGTDIMGLLKRILITEALVNEIVATSATGVDFQTFTLMNELNNILYLNSNTTQNSNLEFNFINGVQYSGGSLGGSIPSYRPAKYIPQVGESLWDVIVKYAETNLDFIYPGYQSGYTTAINIAPFVKYNPSYWERQRNPLDQYPVNVFSSDPTENKPYKSIYLNNGYKKITTQLEISNLYRTVSAGPVYDDVNETFGTYEYTQSTNTWGITKQSLDTIFPAALANDTEMQRYARDVFEIVSFPGNEVSSITFDNARHSDIVADQTKSFYRINQVVRIYHKINETNEIKRVYAIAGIKHSINEHEWLTTFILKPADVELVYQNQGPNPTVSMNSLTGDTNFNFTATITDYATETIEEVYWCLNGFLPDIDDSGNYNAAYLGDRFKNNTARTGLTQTWNFDDDGILESPFYGAGYWYVIPYITQRNGWVVAPRVALEVGAPTPVADFEYSQNLTNNYATVTFTDLSRNNEADNPDSFLWNFGDGTTSTLRNPVHVYDPAPGVHSYNVSLTVYALFGGGTNTKTTTITLTEPTMTPNFTFNTVYQNVQFTNTSTNVGFEEPDAYLWDFGDGTTSTLKNPYHTFAAAQNDTLTYTVTLTTRNVWETTASVSKTVTIQSINSSGTLPIRYVQIKQQPYATPGGYTLSPIMRDFKGRTSTTFENLTFRHSIVHMQKTNVVFHNARGDIESTAANLEGNLRRDSTTNPTYNWGIYALATSPGVSTSYTLTLDLFNLSISPPATYTQVMQNIIMGFKPINSSQPAYYPPIEVWTTDYTGSDMTNPDAYTWFKIGQWTIPGGGSLTDSNRLMTATVSMPPNRP